MNEFSRSNRTKNVPGLQAARERAWQPRSGSNGHAFKVWLDGQSASNQKLLERLQAENAQLRASVVDLILKIQALRDGAR